jgi:competence protein ComEC
MLYDAGSMRGPDVGSRIIAPMIRHFGHPRINSVILSHSDIDHINALPDVVEMMNRRIGSVAVGGGWQNTEATRAVMANLKKHDIRVDTIGAGDRLADFIDVLHPPHGWKGATANENSVVLLIHSPDGGILLTGDLEGAGLAKLLQQPRRQVTVLQGPHHGSKRLDIEGLMKWADPQLVVTQESKSALSDPNWKSPYERPGVTHWSTDEHGAVIIKDGEAEGFQSKEKVKLRKKGKKTSMHNSGFNPGYNFWTKTHGRNPTARALS